MKLSDIRDIVRILQKYGGSGVADRRKKNSKFSRFHILMQHGAGQTEKEIGRQIFGSYYSPNRYKSLKTHYLSKVLQEIPSLNISTSDLSEYTKVQYKAYKHLFYVRTLLSLGSRQAGIHFAKRLLHVANRYEFHVISLSLIEELQRYAVLSGNEKEHRKFLQLTERHLGLLVNESKIGALEEQVLIHFSKSFFIDEKSILKARRSVAQVKTLLKNHDTYFGRLSYLRLQYAYYQISGDPLKSANICEEAIKYMEMKPHMSPPSRFAEFALYKLENFILARDYVNGKRAVRYCASHIHPNQILWFSFKQYEFLLLMQTQKFDEAAKVYEEVISHMRYDTLSTLSKERWQLFGLHIQYILQSIAKVDFRESDLWRNKQFKARMLDFPTYKKDKRGFNVALLILTILAALEQNKRDLLIHHEEALDSYRFKYLNEKHCHQSFILFKLIRLVTKNDFDLARIEKKAQPIENELRATKLKPGEIFEGIQILPPEWVWNRIKTILAKKSLQKK